MCCDGNLYRCFGYYHFIDSSCNEVCTHTSCLPLYCSKCSWKQSSDSSFLMSLPSGFVDLQVNGLLGVNFSDAGLSSEGLEKVSGFLAEHGTLAFCPTVITSSMDVYKAVLPILAKGVNSNNVNLPSKVLGIHLEGPFISAEDGAVGAHPRQFTRLPSIELFDELFQLCGGHLAIMTLAPELPGATELIKHAVAKGVVISIGHTLANAAHISEGVAAGATLSTHLGNACPNMMHRHLNPIWPQLANKKLTAMIISDGHHLPNEVLSVVLAAKGAAQTIVTSDAAPPAGLPPGEYAYFGTRVLMDTSGRLRNLEKDTLAGSSATMLQCLNVLAKLDGVTEAELWRVGRDNPLAILKKDKSILNGQRFHVQFDQGVFVVHSSGH